MMYSVEWSYDVEPAELILPLRVISNHCESLIESHCQDLVPFLFLCIEQCHTDVRLMVSVHSFVHSQAIQLVGQLIAKPFSLLFLSTLYNSCHTLCSVDSFNGKRALPFLIPALYKRYVAFLSTCNTHTSSYRMIANTTLTELVTVFFSLCNDYRLLVRREAAKCIADCCSVFDSSLPKCVKAMEAFVRDDVVS